jgi:hypothetical protein
MKDTTADGVEFSLGMTLYQKWYDDDLDSIEIEAVPTSPETHEIRWGQDGSGACRVLARIDDDSLRGMGPVRHFYSSRAAAYRAYIDYLLGRKRRLEGQIETAIREMLRA